MSRSYLLVFLVGLPIVVSSLLISPPSSSSSSNNNNDTTFMQRAQRSFTNLFKLLAASSSNKSMSSSANSNNFVGDSGKLLQTYRINEKLCLTVAQGSVVDFASKSGAIVNCANEGCLGGGGVDGAITDAGGENLAEDRLNLPKINGVRCPTGDAKLTGPGDYGSLGVPFVIHAVGPNYMMFDEENDVETPHRLLRSAYQKSMDCTIGTPIEKVAFALLSAGVFRGSQSLSTVLGIGVEAINDWAKDESKISRSKVEDVVLFAFTHREAHTLVRVCDTILGDAARIGPPMEASSESDISDSGSVAKEVEDAKLDNDEGTCEAEKFESDVQEEKKKESGEEDTAEETGKISKEDQQEMTDTEEKDSPTKA